VRVRVLLRYLRPHTPALALAAGLALVTAAAALAQPLLAREVVASVGPQGLSREGTLAAAVLVAALLVAAVLSGVQAYVLRRTGEAVVRDARLRLTRHVLRLPVTEFDRRRGGDLLSRVGSDTTLLRVVVQSGVVDAASGVVTAAGALVLMAVVDPVLLGVTVVAVGVVLAVAGAVVRRIQRLTREAQEAVGEMTAGVDRAIGAVRTVRAARAEEREGRLVETAVRAAFGAGVRLARVEAVLGPVASVAIQGAFVAVLGVGGARVASGAAGIEDLVAFVFLLFLLIQPLASAIQAATAVQSGLGAVGRIEEVLALPDEAAAAAPARAGAPGLQGPRRDNQRSGHVTPPVGPVPPVEFRDVVFTYADGPQALRGVSFRAVRGGTTALVGPSGAGKSTTLALVERFYEVDGGAVLVDGVDVRDRAHDDLRARMAYVEQDARHWPAPSPRTCGWGRRRRPTPSCAPSSPRSTCSASSTAPRSGSRPRSATTGCCCPAASASAWPSPGRCWREPRCCCSTSRPPTSTPPTRPPWPARSPPPGGPPACSSSPIGSAPSPAPTGSSSSTPGGWWAAAPTPNWSRPRRSTGTWRAGSCWPERA
jgi:ATP-binding cassette subfamily B protein/ATP-binding cassette subfamily C protein